MSNRVEDLETQVAELQATIDGLTEEIVETKERVAELEAQAETFEAAVAEPAENGRSPAAEESQPQSTAEQQAAARGTDERRDALLVENDVEPADEPDAEPQTEEPEEEADDDDDDIIVA
jgi:uncharacterized coiled-coil protein SlyX